MEPFIGQIMMFAGNFAPRGWAFCNGQLLSIAQNTALFSILGTTYGGDGKTTFALPDLRGRAPLHWGHGPGLSNRNLGESGGQETVTLTVDQMPAHGHLLTASNDAATARQPKDAVLAQSESYTQLRPNVILSQSAITNAGDSQPHPNMQPFLGISFVIALQGIFPSRE